MVGENGNKLSGGQRQKLFLARALYGNPAIVVMDEPTSALDKENTELFYQLISRFKESKTFIIITHDKKIKNLSNRNYSIKDGNILNL